MTKARRLAHFTDLSVELPDGSPVVSGITMSLRAGQVVALLGPSGAGKTTLLRSLFSPDELRRDGFVVEWQEREVNTDVAFVPQRGALLDHLDVPGNVKLAMSVARAADSEPPPSEAHSEAPTVPRQQGKMSVDEWLKRVELGEDIAQKGRAVATLSGGQAQRVAVARVLAAGRKLIVMDEPSVGLDPMGVRNLAQLLMEQARRQGAAIIVVTHDLAFAGGAADTIYFLDIAKHRLTEVEPWSGPAELDKPEKRQRRLAELETRVEELLLQERPPRGGGRRRRFSIDAFGPFRVAGNAVIRALSPRLFVESMVVFKQAAVQSLLRPLLFYATTAGLLGFTVPYVIADISKDLRPAAVFALLKGTYVLSLAPPLSAILFVATSGSAVAAWLGGLRLHGQVTALEGIGVAPDRYLWSPAWFALAWCYLATFVTFVAAMIAGGYVMYASSGVVDPLAVLTADFVDPPPSRYRHVMRSLWSVLAYAAVVPSVVVHAASKPKSESSDVTSAMTSSIMRVTLIVVALELFSVTLLRWFDNG